MFWVSVNILKKYPSAFSIKIFPANPHEKYNEIGLKFSKFVN